MNSERDAGSFRDPSGFIFCRAGAIYRQVNAPFADRFQSFLKSGLYAELVERRLLVAHEEVDLRLPDAPPAHVVLLPEQIPFVSYPYEWSFSQLKAAALLTLDVQARALARGQVLRDASAYNVQFVGTRAVFIDTLSFAPLVEGQPWAAYRQFCQHFLAPLALMALVDPRLGELSRTHIDGVPLPLAAALLPLTSRLKPGLLMHLHLHGRSESKARTERAPSSADGQRARGAMGRTAMLGLVDSLRRTVSSLDMRAADTLWSTYGSHLNYTAGAQDAKRTAVAGMLANIKSVDRLDTVWDLGANTGEYTRIAADAGARVVSFDGDHLVTDTHFRNARDRQDECVLPLVQDLANPSPALGWDHRERKSFAERGPADAVMALALTHHLAIGGNVPLPSVAAFFRRLCRHLIVEFIPKEDSQVQRMLAAREDIFDDYTIAHFERAFSEQFQIVRAEPIPGTIRTIYLMSARS
jgi:ribosomal protein L11 methylase PrmA